MTDKVTKVLEALVAGLEEALASTLLTDEDVIEVLEGLQIEIDDMLEQRTAKIGEADEDEDI